MDNIVNDCFFPTILKCDFLLPYLLKIHFTYDDFHDQFQNNYQ